MNMIVVVVVLLLLLLSKKKRTAMRGDPQKELLLETSREATVNATT